jgi:hypothetical protein
MQLLIYLANNTKARERKRHAPRYALGIAWRGTHGRERAWPRQSVRNAARGVTTGAITCTFHPIKAPSCSGASELAFGLGWNLQVFGGFGGWGMLSLDGWATGIAYKY